MKKSLTLKENITAMLTYSIGWVSGLIVLLLEKDNDFVRYHAMQSIVVFGIVTLLSTGLSMLYFFYGPLMSMLNLVVFALWIVLMVKAYQHEKFKLPIISEIVNNLLKKNLL